MKKSGSHNFHLVPIALGTCTTLVVFLIGLVLMPRPFYKDGFTTLADLEAYAKTRDENTKMDSDNTIKPDFTSYYKTLAPTFISKQKEKLVRLLTLVKLKHPPLWSASFFKTQLEALAKDRQAKGFKGEFVCKITPTPASKIVVFGNVQGSLHSLVRCLKKINELGIIGPDLKITNPDCFIIFMGDIVSRSPFTMETLSVVMRLMQVNPDNVVYLRGNHESNNYWQEHTLKTELQIRAAHLANATIPLADQVNAFFDTLPLAGYITTENPGEIIRLSDSGRDQNEKLNEQNYAKFLTSKAAGKCACGPIAGGEQGDQAVEVKVIFKGEKKRETYQPHDGLRLLSPDMGATAWTLLSCPSFVYQKSIKFVHDAFVVLTSAKELDEWKITLYNRNVQSQEPFKATTFSLLSGIEDGGKKSAPKAPEAKEKKKETKEKPEKKEKAEKKEEKKVEAKEEVASKKPAAPKKVEQKKAEPTATISQESAFKPQQAAPAQTLQAATPTPAQPTPAAPPASVTSTIVQQAQTVAQEAQKLATQLQNVAQQQTVPQPQQAAPPAATPEEAPQ